MALEAYALVTLESVKRRLGIDPGDTSIDADLEDRINEISYYIHGDGIDNRGILNRHLTARDYTNELYQGENEQDLLLDNYPINSVTSVEYRYFYPGTFYTLDSDDYFIHRKKYSVVREYGWTRFGFSTGYLTRADLPFYNIRISYNAGYTTIPMDIQGIVKDGIADLVSIDQTGGQGLKQYKINDVSITWKDKFYEENFKAIKKYRIIKF